ncbi:MAG TPA: hypothetical protein VF669_14110 [Tepidisphaeraceae bacterium]|jgi:hypothetical protein
MSRKNLLLTLLSISAVLLLVANVLVPNYANAQVSVKERDYQVVTARVPSGGDGIYILDSRTGQVGVFSYDSGSRTIEARAVRPLTDAFNTR